MGMGLPTYCCTMPAESDELKSVEDSARRDLAASMDEQALEAWRIAYLGRGGHLTRLLRSLRNRPLQERRNLGEAANRLKQELESLSLEKRENFRRQTLETAIGQRLDVTLPGRPLPQGRLHPITQTLHEVIACFVSMGFQVVEGPEVEWDSYNFQALRIPKDHPARDMWATIWIDYERKGEHPMLMRTHTSPNQVRFMEHNEPPVRIIVPGKVYRFEATDSTHDWMHTQVEGLAVDEGITMGDLKGTLEAFARRLFGGERKTFFHCDYFPFTEPSLGMLIDCFLCGGDGHLANGKGCSTCKRTGWIEILGAGMVHPEIIYNVGYDPERYTGFAWGIGIERIAMLRHGVEDIRLFYANDIRFLEQF